MDIPLIGDENWQDLVFVIFLVAILVFISRLFTFKIRKKLTGKVKKDRLESMIKFVNFMLILIVFFTILPIIGVHISGLLVVAGIIGIAIGFASQSIVANFLSGIFYLNY